MPRGTQQRRLSRAELEAEMARATMRHDVVTRFVDTIKWPIIVVSAWVPLQVMEKIVDHLAGKTTVVDANVALSVTISYSVVSSIGWAVSASRSRRRKNTVEATRARTDGLEGKLLGIGGT